MCTGACVRILSFASSKSRIYGANALLKYIIEMSHVRVRRIASAMSSST